MRRAAPRPRKLDPYTQLITERLAPYPALNAIRLFTEVQAAGYPGGITQLREYLARVRPHPEAEPVVRFETAHGHQLQVDFAECRFPWDKRLTLLIVLGYFWLLATAWMMCFHGVATKYLRNHMAWFIFMYPAVDLHHSYA